MKKKTIRSTEWNILICVIILVIIGLVALYSATINSELYEFKKQCIYVLISVPILIFSIIIDYDIICRFSKYFYVLLTNFDTYIAQYIICNFHSCLNILSFPSLYIIFLNVIK